MSQLYQTSVLHTYVMVARRYVRDASDDVFELEIVNLFFRGCLPVADVVGLGGKWEVGVVVLRHLPVQSRG